jgi:transcriptional regulator with XRE-family HTH domain
MAIQKNKGDILFNNLSKRLKIIRTELGFSQTKITEDLELKLNSYIRLETGKGGSIVTLLLVLDYFAEHGYNYKWILKENNEEEFRKEDNMRFFTFPKEEIIKRTKAIKRNVSGLEKLLEGFDI